MDKGLVALFRGKRNGVFVEAGASNGVDQSNTFLLERKYGWTGLLVEPISSQFRSCKKVRKKAFVENCCLTSFANTPGESIMVASGLTSRVLGKGEFGGEGRKEIVKNQNLSALLAKYNLNDVDIMSLDVEGSEFDVLDGYDYKSKIVDYLLIETWDIQRFFSYANERHWQYVDSWGGSDHMFKLR